MPTVTKIDPCPESALLWRMFPTWEGVGAVSVPNDKVARLVGRGWLKINGERASVDAAIPEDCGRTMLRVTFDRKYPYPHP